MKKVLAIIIVLLLFLSVLVSCHSENENPYFQSLSSLYIPDGVKIVGFGEATHGSHEFKALANEVFRRLVTDYGFRAFAIEAPLGNIMGINEYIVYGIGTAREAVRNNGFWVHNFQETVDLVEWMRDFNLTAEAGNELRFYGYDIQEINVSRQRYLTFMRNVDTEKAIRDEANFGNINSWDVFNIENELLIGYIQYLYSAIKEMRQNEEVYVQASSQLEFDFALRNLLGIKWTMEMHTLLTETDMSTMLESPPDDFDWYNEISQVPTDFGASFEFRDKRMYENIKWIMQQEEKRGHGRVFVFAHNAHIMKDLYMGLRPFGVHLAAYYGDAYFVIGTEFYMGAFIAFQSELGLVEGSLINDTSELINKFMDSNVDVGVLNMRRHIEADGRMGEILNSEQLMATVGAVFWPEVPARAFQFTTTPAASYDVIIFVRNATSATAVN